MTIQTEGGIRPSRVEMVEESEQGVTPSDPDWQLISDRVTSFETDGFGPEAVEKAGLGETVYDIEPGLEEPALSLAHDLQRWFVDGSGDPNDLSAYGFLRVAGSTPASLTIVERMTSGDNENNVLIAPESTIDYHYNDNESATAKESRIYTVAKGCEVETPTLTADPSEVTWGVETDVMCDHGRSYQIDQPPSPTVLNIQSTDPADTNLDVYVENEAGDETDTITTDGADATTAVVGTTQMSDIDAIEVRDSEGNIADHAGDIVVSIDDTGTPGEALAVLYGSNLYGNTYGDPGVPPTEGGSHASEIGTEFYKVGNLGMYRPANSLFEAAGSVQTVELSVENDNDRSPQQRSREQRTHIGMQTPELSVTYDSETGSHRALLQRMSMEELNTVLEFDRAGDETVTLPDSVVTESGRSREAGENNTDQEVTLRPQDTITFSTPS